MPVEEYVRKLAQYLGIEDTISVDQKRTVTFFLTLPLKIIALDPGMHLEAKVGPCPQQNRELLFTQFMAANALGQGTGGAILALDAEEKSLTLSWTLPYEMKFETFREHIEDFINLVLYWKETAKV
jgi:hypothetical protein